MRSFELDTKFHHRWRGPSSGSPPNSIAFTGVFARSIAQGLPVLRPFLLEGRLAAQGLIDRAKLEPLLDAEALIWRDYTGEIMRTVFVEAWVRVWQDWLAATPQGADPASPS